MWVNNAGVSVLAPIIDTSVADMEHMLAVNYMGTFHGVQVAARTMIAGNTPGRIINVASVHGLVACDDPLARWRGGGGA